MRADEIDEVRKIPLIGSASEQSVQELLRGAFLQRFPAHVDLVREGDPADFLHVVVEGQIEIFATYRERETTVSVVGPGNAFILAAVMLDKPYLKSARVLATSRILMIPAQSVREVFTSDGDFALALTKELARAYRGVVKELKNQKLRSSLERLAAWLVRYNTENGSVNAFDLPFDKKVLASRLGMAPEVLSRTFVTLQAYGMKVEGRRISLTKVPDLTRLAEPSELIDNPLT